VGSVGGLGRWARSVGSVGGLGRQDSFGGLGRLSTVVGFRSSPAKASRGKLSLACSLPHQF